MIHLIFKNLWAHRGRNGWLLTEIIIISFIMWLNIDPIIVTFHDQSLPNGITQEGLYRVTLSSWLPTTNNYKAEEDSAEAKIKSMRTLIATLRNHKDVASATMMFNGLGPFCQSSSTTIIEEDSANVYNYWFMYFEPQSDFFRTIGFDEVEGQTNEQLDQLTFANKEIIMTLHPKSTTPSIGYNFKETKTDSIKYIAKGSIGRLIMRAGMQPSNVLLMPIALDAANIPEDVVILLRKKSNVDERRFVEDLREWSNNNLRIGNLYVQNISSYRDLIEENAEENAVNYTYRVNLILGSFFLINLCLGVFGTFWIQTRSRREEIGVLKSFGGSSLSILRLFLGEGLMLTTMGTLIGCIIYLQFALKEGLYTNMWDSADQLLPYWINNFTMHFIGVSAIIWIILLIIVSIGIYVPARSISRIPPTDALRDE
ncbi:MAG: FtsX-like permease family protein [Bacteroidales bacterium]